MKYAPISGLETHPGEYFYGRMNPLARIYDKFSVTDSNIRYLKFKNTLNGVQGAGVQAIVKFADGHQEVQDWTGRSSVEFCFDDHSGSSDDVTDLVVMYSNSNWTEVDDTAAKHSLTIGEQPSLKFRDACESYTYKILGATLTTSAKGTPGHDGCDLAGITTKESRSLSGELVGQPTPLVSKLETATVNGARNVSGKIDAAVKESYTDSVDSCQFDLSGDIVPCSYTSPVESYPSHVNFAVDYQPWPENATTLKGTWWVDAAEIGVASGSYPTNWSLPLHAFPGPDRGDQSPDPAGKADRNGPADDRLLRNEALRARSTPGLPREDGLHVVDVNHVPASGREREPALTAGLATAATATTTAIPTSVQRVGVEPAAWSRMPAPR